MIIDVISLIAGALKLADMIAKYAHDRQLISAGVAEAVAAGNAATLANMEKARRAKDAVDRNTDPDWAERLRNRADRDK